MTTDNVTANPETTTETTSQPSLLDIVRERRAEATNATPEDTEPVVETEVAAEPVAEVKDPEDEIIRARIEIKERKKRLEKQERKLSARESRVKELEELFTLWESDPYAFVEKAKIDPRKWAERVVAANVEPDPMTEVERVKKELEDYKAAQEAERTRGEYEARERQLLSYVHNQWTAAAPKYEHIALLIEDGEFSSEDLARKAYEDVLTHYQNTGEDLELDDVFAYYDKQIEAQLTTAAQRWQRRNKSATEAQKPSAKPNATVSTVKREATQTLTNRDAVVRTQPQSAEERKKALLAKHFGQ
jgi:hypothetical protein